MGYLQQLTASLPDPAYISLLKESPPQPADIVNDGPGPPEFDSYLVLTAIAERIGAISRGGSLDLDRAARHLIRWWRAGGHMKGGYEARCKTVRGWGLDFEFDEEIPLGPLPRVKAGPTGDATELGDPLQARMEDIVGDFVEGLKRTGTGMGISATQQKKREREEKKRLKVEKYKQSIVNRQAP
jgi:hypothetical protein